MATSGCHRGRASAWRSTRSLWTAIVSRDGRAPQSASRVAGKSHSHGKSMETEGMNMPGADYDLILQGGRVIDPANDIDGVRDVAIAGGKIAAVAAELSPGRARKVIPV